MVTLLQAVKRLVLEGRRNEEPGPLGRLKYKDRSVYMRKKTAN